MKYANVREGCLNGDCILIQTPTKVQVADLFTKQISGPDFARFREVLMGRVAYPDMVEDYNQSQKGAAEMSGLTKGAKYLVSFRDCIMGRGHIETPGYGSTPVSA